MPSDDDTRYGSTAPPTLEQLQAMLESLASVKAYRNRGGTRTRIIFDIDAAKLHERGGSCYSTGEQIAQVMLDTISRMIYFDGVTAQYAGSDRTGTTPADIQAFINNELKHVPPSGDLASSMRRRMYAETLQKLVELGTWRAAMDAARFQKQREAERKRREDLERVKREADDLIRKQNERMREKAERDRKESAAGADRRTKGGKESHNPFEEDFAEAFSSSERAHWERVFEEHLRGASSRNSSFSWGFDRSQQEKPKARNKGRAPWYDVLGVSSAVSDIEVRKAYQRLASRYHPDKCKDTNATEKMADINTAWDEVKKLRGLV